MAKSPLSEKTQAILDEFAKRRGVSRRAIAEMKKSLAGLIPPPERCNNRILTHSTYWLDRGDVFCFYVSHRFTANVLEGLPTHSY